MAPCREASTLISSRAITRRSCSISWRSVCLDHGSPMARGDHFLSYGVDVEGLGPARSGARIWRRAFCSCFRRRTAASSISSSSCVASATICSCMRASGRRAARRARSARPRLDPGEFLQSRRDFGKVVVHGHTPGGTEMRANRIGIDTGAVFTDRLTALRLEDGSRRLLQADA